MRGQSIDMRHETFFVDCNASWSGVMVLLGGGSNVCILLIT